VTQANEKKQDRAGQSVARPQFEPHSVASERSNFVLNHVTLQGEKEKLRLSQQSNATKQKTEEILVYL
jgi:hypothetical protein